MFIHMTIRNLHIVLGAALLLLCSASVHLQPTDAGAAARSSLRTAVSDADQSEREARKLLLGAKDALSSGNVRFLKPRLGGKVYLNLFTGINGYYSSAQAFLILESFFSTYTPISFSFSSRNFSIRNPYGFGPLTYERRGRRGTAELFISLAVIDGKWVINQITIASR